MEEGIKKFFRQFAFSMYVGDEHRLDDITEDELYEHFRHATNSASQVSPRRGMITQGGAFV